MLNLNMNFDEFVVSRPDDQQWQHSLADGVSRIHLEREAEESGHTTSIVKFKAGASFPRHVHIEGEEIYVLEGVFSDENGDYPAGSYIRNPPGTSHAPFTKEGCILFVKLDQFLPEDNQTILILPQDQQWQQGMGGLTVLGLHTFATQSTALVHWPENECFQPHTHWGGEEILVLEGRFIDEHGEYPQGTWIRSPHMSAHHPYVEEETLILVKTGHLGK